MIYVKLFLTFFNIGLFTFGGGYAMIPLIEQEVLNNGWISTEELIDFIAISESTPGPLAVNISTFVGMKMAGIMGAFCATLGVILPSFIIILIVAGIFESFQKSRFVKGAMIGLKGVVVGLIGSSIMSTGLVVFGNAVKTLDIKKMLCMAIVFAVVSIGLVKKIHPVILIAVSAVIGIIL